MHIGLIGGIGPAATLVYYSALVRAHAAAGRRLALTIANAEVSEMIANMAAGRRREQAEIFAGHIDRLRAGGCDAIALTSMGGHFCIRELEPLSSLPIISALPAMEEYFTAVGVRRIGVLGTRAVMESKLYGLRAVEVVTPLGEDLTTAHDAYIAIAASGATTPELSAYFHEAGRKLHRDQGAEIVVLGGTDLSVAFAGTDPGYPIADSALIHADAIAHAAMAG